MGQQQVHKFRIKGVINHLGRSPKNGHYTAIIRSNDEYYYCSDSIINKSNFSNINDTDPYIVLYEKYEDCLKTGCLILNFI